MRDSNTLLATVKQGTIREIQEYGETITTDNRCGMIRQEGPRLVVVEKQFYGRNAQPLRLILDDGKDQMFAFAANGRELNMHKKVLKRMKMALLKNSVIQIDDYVIRPRFKETNKGLGQDVDDFGSFHVLIYKFTVLKRKVEEQAVEGWKSDIASI